MKNKYELYLIKEFLDRYELKKDAFKTPHNEFRFLCYKFSFIIDHFIIPDIQKESLFEAVIVEFRNFPHLNFIIRNTILKLGKKWAFTVICGKENKQMMISICEQISKKIKIIVLPYNNLTQGQYSELLTTANFWNLLKGDKILIYQEDTIIFGNNIIDFLDYDYIGAPFLKNSNDTPNRVGNGGLSLRTRQKMLEVINRAKLSDLVINSSTRRYMQYRRLDKAPEDIYFSKNLQELGLGKVAPYDIASLFASECVFNPNCWGGHKIWIGTKKWKGFIKAKFGFNYYKFDSNLNDYLTFLNKPLQFNKTKEIKNAFDIDLYFYAHINNIHLTSYKEVISHISKIGLDGFIYHPKQIFNLFPSCQILRFNKQLFIFNNKNYYTVQDFIHKFIYHSSFEFIQESTIINKFDSMNKQFDILLLVFIGNETIGIELINKIIKYKKIQKKFNVSFCITSSLMHSEKMKMLIKNNFEFFSIYISNEYGNDIIPTMLMYDMIQQKYNFTHIIKLHTKSIKYQFDNLTDFLLSHPIEKLITHPITDSNCIGYQYKPLYTDNFNRDSIQKFDHYLNRNFSFVPGTIFYTQKVIMDKVLFLIKNENYRSFLLNNLYDDNSINKHYSPIHFLERLFGVINLNTIK